MCGIIMTVYTYTHFFYFKQTLTHLSNIMICDLEMFFFSFIQKYKKKRNVCILLRYNIHMQYLFYDYNSFIVYMCTEYGQTLNFLYIYF